VAYQPGPVLQPFVYFEGLRVGGLHAGTMVLDIPRPFPGAVEGLIYTPANPDGQFRGPINLRDAMSSGLLPPAVWAANRQRMENILRGAHLIGINSLDENARYDLSLLERGGEVAPLDVTYAYSVFAGMGSMRGLPVQPLGRSYRGRDPVAVLRIEDAAGEVLWEYAGDTYEPDCAAATNCTPVFQGELAYLVNDILADQSARSRVLGGAAGALDVARHAAVVAGMTSDNRDAWAVGYTPQLAVGVHLGRADQAAMSLVSFGLEGAAPVWNAVTRYAHETLAPVNWTRPNNIVEGAVCERSGLLPNEACPVRREIFIENIQPRQVDTYWQTVEINNQTGQLATSSTPTGLVSERVYFVPPPDALDWWEANNLPLPPTEFDTVSRPGLLGAAAILEPASYAYVGGVVDIRGSLDPTNMQFYQLAFGRGLNPEEWVQIGPQQTTYTRGASLGQWDTTGLDGLYSLRLTVVMNDNSVESDVRQVSVDNIPPQITLVAGEQPGQVFLWPDDRVIPLAADVTDNLAVNRVEFYYDGTFIGTDNEWPYGFEWTIQRTGTERFSAVAFDAIGNQASSEITVEVRRAGS
jgi:membrane carboxypeptidase/penicillin-binding protein PbpC